MTTKWRVTYPGLTQDLTRDFDDEATAKRFAEQRRNYTGRYALPNDWRHVKVVAVESSEFQRCAVCAGYLPKVGAAEDCKCEPK